MPVDAETAKKWLQRYGNLQAKISALIARSEALRAKASSPGSPKMDGMPQNRSWETSAMANLIDLHLLIENEAREKIARSKELYKEIDATIRKIRGSGSAEMRLVLQMKYLDLFGWTDIHDALWMTKDDFLDKEDSYVRRTFKIHKNALLELAQFIDVRETDLQEIDGF